MKLLLVFALLAPLVSGETYAKRAIRLAKHPEDRELKGAGSNSEDLETFCGSCLACDVAGDGCDPNQAKRNICANCGLVGICVLCQRCTNNNCSAAEFVNQQCAICEAGQIADGVTLVEICFSDVSTVDVLGHGATFMKDLQVGDQILTPEGAYESVYAFAHHDTNRTAEFLQIYSKNNAQPLRVTADHLVYKLGSSTPVPAKEIRVGDTLQGNTPWNVTKIDTTTRTGVYAPLTKSGTLLVDGVAASSYVHLPDNNSGLHEHSLIHLLLAPQRLLCNVFSSQSCQTSNYHEESGMPYYVYYGLLLLHWLFQANPLTRIVGLTLVYLATGVCFGIEKAIEAPTFLWLVGGAAVAYHQVNKHQMRKKVKTV